jgi:hypothetical protein
MTVEQCSGIRDDFVKCVLRTNCVLRQNRTVADCVKHPEELPEQCLHLMSAFNNCKKGLVSLEMFDEGFSQARELIGMACVQLDMRKRFRGNITTTSKPASAEPVADISL